MRKHLAGSKRNFLRLALAGMIGWLTSPKPSLAETIEKMSKQQAEYQDSPKGIQMCATCTLFDEPHACKIVEGDISPNGWCKAYAIAD
jgi:High potential iron-sulfur protein